MCKPIYIKNSKRLKCHERQQVNVQRNNLETFLKLTKRTLDVVKSAFDTGNKEMVKNDWCTSGLGKAIKTSEG